MAKPNDKNTSAKHEEKNEEGMSPGQSVLLELGGLGLVAHAVEMSEHISTPGAQGQQPGQAPQLNIDPRQQIKPSKAFKPR